MTWKFHEYPENWEEIKKQALERANYQCERCETKGIELHVHHIIPLSKGGTSESSNLQVLCKKCHSKQHPHMPSEATAWGKCIYLKIKTTGKITCAKLPVKLSKDERKKYIMQDEFNPILCAICPVPNMICKHLRFSLMIRKDINSEGLYGTL